LRVFGEDGMHGTCLREIRLLGLHEEPVAPGSEWHFCTGSLPGLDIVINDYSVLFPRHLRQSSHSNIKAHKIPSFNVPVALY